MTTLTKDNYKEFLKTATEEELTEAMKIGNNTPEVQFLIHTELAKKNPSVEQPK